ncbi:MAG: hypothetical protein WAN14_13850 [Candidatus Acidiferrales bacterium]
MATVSDSRTKPSRTLLFAPCGFNLAETSRMLEIALGVARDHVASTVFSKPPHLRWRQLRAANREAPHCPRMDPRLMPEKIEHIAKMDRGEKFTPAFTDAEIIQCVENELFSLAIPLSDGAHRR